MQILPSATPESDLIRRFLLHSAFPLLAPLFVTSIALIVLYSMSVDINLVDVKSEVSAYPRSVLVLSFGAMFTSYLALSLYDIIMMRGVTDVKLPHGVPMMTGVSSIAVSNLFGFAWLTGGAIRYRVYAAFGVDIRAIARLIAMSWIAFFVGLLVVLSGLMLVQPQGFSEVIPLSPPHVKVLGLVMAGTIVAYFIWTAKKRRSIIVGQFRINLPLANDGLKMTLISTINLAATALTLYVLMPTDLSQNFVFFFVIFVVALGLGILSHSPGGVGVFEATIIVGVGASGRSDALAALFMYRMIYTILPFIFAVIGLAIAWVLANRQSTSTTSKIVFDAITPIVPLVSAGLVMLSGAVLLISGNLPSDPGRVDFLRAALPLHLVETSHLLASVSGVLLMIFARGLYRRMFRAWLLAVILLGIGLTLSLLKGFDWEEALTMALAIAFLWVFRKAFYRVDVLAGMRPNWKWTLSVALLVGVISWIGFFAYNNVEYSNTLWWQFAWKGDAPRFLRATFSVAVVLAALMLNTLLSKQTTRLKSEPIPDVVRLLTLASSYAGAGISLSGDKRFIVTPDKRSYLAYSDTGSSLVSIGDPVGDKVAGRAVIWQFRELADKMGRRCAFYAVSEKFLSTYLDLGLQILKIGEVARVDLRTFTLEGSRRKDWRHARARVARDGYEFSIIKVVDLAPVIDNLRSVSDAWLKHKASEEKGFSLGWFNPDYIKNFDIAVLRDVQTGRIIAFANLMQSGNKSELSLDLMRYDPIGSSVAMDALFAEIMLWGKAQGFIWFSLGAAPLSGFESHRLAPFWHRLGSFLYEHGEQFYHFDGLRCFKQKFDPEWSPEYLASSSRLDAARVLFEVSQLVSRGTKEIKKNIAQI
jgi:phosphatidylglycerol lysyltransferase